MIVDVHCAFEGEYVGALNVLFGLCAAVFSSSVNGVNKLFFDCHAFLLVTPVMRLLWLPNRVA